MSVLDLVQANYNSMTATQRKISDFIINNYSELVFMTADEIAVAVRTSTTSVIRFTRAIGFSGYSEFLQDLRKESVQKESVPARLHKKRGQRNSPLMKRNLDNTLSNIEETVTMINSNGCGTEAARLFVNAGRILVYGTCSMSGVAQYLVSNLRMLHENVYQLQGIGGVYAEEFLNLKKGDVVVLFLFPRYEFLILKLLPILKEKNVKIIIFTSTVYDPIKDMGDVFIPCSVKGIATRDSLTTIMFAIDYLISEVIELTDFEKMEKLAENMENMVTQFYCGQ